MDERTPIEPTPMPEGWVGTTRWLQLSPTAMEAVRLKFNPSGSAEVDEIKILAAALISKMESIRNLRTAGREASVAITELETAAMWAVKAATKGL